MSDLISAITQAIQPPSPFQGMNGLGGSGPQATVGNSDDPTGIPKMGLLDHVLFALRGTPDSMLSPDKVAARHADAQNASKHAVSAYENPGEEYMGPPVVGAKGGGLDIGNIIKLISGAGGL